MGEARATRPPPVREGKRSVQASWGEIRSPLGRCGDGRPLSPTRAGTAAKAGPVMTMGPEGGPAGPARLGAATATGGAETTTVDTDGI